MHWSDEMDQEGHYQAITHIESKQLPLLQVCVLFDLHSLLTTHLFIQRLILKYMDPDDLERYFWPKVEQWGITLDSKWYQETLPLLKSGWTQQPTRVPPPMPYYYN